MWRCAGSRDIAKTSGFSFTASTLLLLYIFRIICCFAYGYIHPDEFFQSGQELFFRSSLSTAPPIWEWEPQNALRSILPSYFMTLFPLNIYNSLCRHATTRNGIELLFVPRIFMCLVSFAGMDAMAWNLIHNNTEKQKHGIPSVLLVLASSWTTLLFGTRPFTNTLEAITLSVLLVLVFVDIKMKKFVLAFLVGCICSIGLFTRLTFVGFASPIVFAFLCKCAKDHYSTLSFWRHYRLEFLYVTFFVICGALATFLLFLHADVTFYHRSTLWELVQLKSWTVIFNSITPLNFLRYNLNSENLSLHGLHPRYLHLLVNMPLMFGPLAALHWAYIGRFMKRWLYLMWRKKETNIVPLRFNTLELTLNAVILSGLFMLSCAPHQEPRFLFPLIVPLSILHAETLCSRRRLTLFWILFNLALLCFFGLLHQSGVIPSMLFLGSQLSLINTSVRPVTIIYFKTYMPPSFLLHTKLDFQFISPLSAPRVSWKNQHNDDGSSIQDSIFCEQGITCTPNQSKLIDLSSLDMDSFCRFLRMSLPDTSEDQNQMSFPMFIVMPVVVARQTSCNYMMNEVAVHYSFHRVWGRQGHVSTEDLPQWTNISDGLFAGLRSLIRDLDLAVYSPDYEVERIAQ